MTVQIRGSDSGMSRRVGMGAAFAAALSFGAGPVEALTFDTDIPDLRIQWDTTVKYTAAARVRGRSDGLLVSPSNSNLINLDDGDRNFNKGLISNRWDVLSEVDLSYRNFGGRVSGAAWYDPVYAGDSAFNQATQKLHGRKGELLDAFVYGKFDLGAGGSLTARAGRHALQWGESLFFGSNAIAGGMAPVDVIKAVSVPNTPFRELLRPVGQVSAQLQLLPNLALGAYVPYRWEPSRLPGAGSYFSSSDLAPLTGEALMPYGAPQTAAVRARDTGQGGIQVRWRPHDSETDLGFYAIRYHDKVPQQFLTLAPSGGPGGFLPSNYYYAYPEGINAFGVSASHTLGEHNLAAEVSVRTHAPLMSVAATMIPAIGVSSSYARGTTLHANFNTVSSLGPSVIARESSLTAEVAMNYTQKVTENAASVDPNAQRFGMGLRVVFEPTYRQVMDGLDIGVPIGLGYTPAGKSSAGGSLGPHRGGDITFGLNAAYLDVWRISLNYTHYYGPQAPYLDAQGHQSFLQTLKDRDFISLSVRRSF